MAKSLGVPKISRFLARKFVRGMSYPPQPKTTLVSRILGQSFELPRAPRQAIPGTPRAPEGKRIQRARTIVLKVVENGRIRLTQFEFVTPLVAFGHVPFTATNRRQLHV